VNIRDLSRSKKRVGDSGVRSIYCDECGEPIEPELGRVEWLLPKDGDPPSIGLHIVHMASREDRDDGCLYDRREVERNGNDLQWRFFTDFLGRKGRMLLKKLRREGLLSVRDAERLARRFHRGRR
jgi:hypothetical protein